MHSTRTLYDELSRTLIMVDKQIERAKRDAANSLPIHIKPEDDIVYATKYMDGKYVLADLLVARANIVSSMANIKAAEMTSRTR